MTPVDQSKLHARDGVHNGNCFAACLASMLDLPLWMVPPFEEMFSRDNWLERVQEWLRTMFGVHLRRMSGHDIEHLPEFYIASGLSPRGVRHSVIFSAGALVHDPHPSRAGIADVEWTWHLTPAGR